MKYGYKILLLALPLGGVGGGLLSCRSARTIETSETENVDVVVCSKDSMVRSVDFQFDRLEYWVDYVCAGGDADSTGTAVGVKQRHIVVSKGTISEQTSKESISDSIVHQSTHQQSVSTHSLPFWEGMGVGSWMGVGFWAFFLGAAIVVIFLIIKRIRLPT